MKRLPQFSESIEEIFEESNNIFYRLIDKIDVYDPFTLTDLRKKNYIVNGKLQEDILFDDIQRILVYIDLFPQKFLLKEPNQDLKSCFLHEITIGECQTCFSMIQFTTVDEKNPKKEKRITAWNVIQKKLSLISFKNAAFFSTTPGVYSIFRGFPFKKLSMFNLHIIEKFLLHTRDIICNRDIACFTYVSKWLSFIFRYPGKKAETAIILTGPQGAGKSIWTKTICNLLGIYANPNARLENVCGSFNLGIVDKILIIINEVGSYTDISNAQNNNIKTAITDTAVDITKKHKDAFTYMNIANFIFVSNEPEPLKIEVDDRRFLVLEVNDKKCKDKEYFVELANSFEAPGFYENLLTYFLVQKVDKIVDIEIPFTEAKEHIVNVCSGYFETFINVYKKNFIQGISIYEAPQLYHKWTLKNHVRPLNNSEFNRNIKRFCYKKRIRTKHGRVYTWFLKEELKPKITDEEEEEEEEEVHEEEEEVVQKEEVHEEEEEEEEEKGFFEQFPLKSFDDDNDFDDDDILSFF